MGVEPTTRNSALRVTDFEDREAHRDLYTPAEDYSTGFLERIPIGTISQDMPHVAAFGDAFALQKI